MTGTIRTYCDSCGREHRVEVNFPSPTAGFELTEWQCPDCGTVQVVTDEHEYDEEGHIITPEEEISDYMPCLDIETDNPAEACQGCMNCPGWK